MFGDDSTFFTTVVSFGLISLFIYLFVLPRILLPNGGGGGGGAATAGARSNNNTSAAAAGSARRGSPTNDSRSASSSAAAQQPACTRVPPHVSEQSARIAQWGGMNLLVEGMVPFRYTKAATIQEQSSQQLPLSSKTSLGSPGSNSSSNRKDRARILSNLFHDTLSSNNTSDFATAAAATAPPEKGSTIVISIPSQDLDCSKLRRVLYLLGTYYNILVIIVVNSSFSIKEIPNLRNKLRGGGTGDAQLGENMSDAAPAAVASGPSSSSSSLSSSLYLPADILPDHRIVAASTVSARVAFARQLARKDLILDFDAEVSEQLMRFGHRVITYGLAHHDRREQQGSLSSSSSDQVKRVSKLGRLLHA